MSDTQEKSGYRPDLEAYSDTHGKLAQAIEGVEGAQLTWKSSPSAWSVTEVLGHLADHNIVVSFRIRDLLADTKAQFPAFEQDNWVNGQHTNAGSAADILALFGALLRYNGLLLSRLTEADWQKTAINQKGDTVRAGDVIAGFTKHVHHHIGQIERIKRAYAESAQSADAAASSRS